MKKLLGVMFVALLIAALLPVVASAEIVDSGTCGDNLTWTLDDEGTLTISGTGAMVDYSQSNYAPWRGEGVKNAVIEDGVTGIGSRAFSECVNLASVTIPDGVTTIGEHAFDVCRSLTSITIPDGVTTIGPRCFLWMLGPDEHQHSQGRDQHRKHGFLLLPQPDECHHPGQRDQHRRPGFLRMQQLDERDDSERRHPSGK